LRIMIGEERGGKASFKRDQLGSEKKRKDHTLPVERRKGIFQLEAILLKRKLVI